MKTLLTSLLLIVSTLAQSADLPVVGIGSKLFWDALPLEDHVNYYTIIIQDAAGTTNVLVQSVATNYWSVAIKSGTYSAKVFGTSLAGPGEPSTNILFSVVATRPGQVKNLHF